MELRIRCRVVPSRQPSDEHCLVENSCPYTRVWLPGIGHDGEPVSTEAATLFRAVTTWDASRTLELARQTNRRVSQPTAAFIGWATFHIRWRLARFSWNARGCGSFPLVPCSSLQGTADWCEFLTRVGQAIAPNRGHRRLRWIPPRPLRRYLVSLVHPAVVPCHRGTR
ncbi:hypothetical protein VTI74DRAFT_6360 [Chaetomium olivicolor]